MIFASEASPKRMGKKCLDNEGSNKMSCFIVLKKKIGKIVNIEMNI